VRGGQYERVVREVEDGLEGGVDDVDRRAGERGNDVDAAQRAARAGYSEVQASAATKATVGAAVTIVPEIRSRVVFAPSVQRYLDA
jgi:hypothetical protein